MLRRAPIIAVFVALLGCLGYSLVCLAGAEARIGEAETNNLRYRIVADVSFNDTPLERAIEALRIETHARIIVNWSALGDAGIERETPVSLRLRNVPLQVVLRQLLHDAGGGNVELGFQVADGAVTISTQKYLDSVVVVRMYDISDLDALWEATGTAAEARCKAMGIDLHRQQQWLFGGGGTFGPAAPGATKQEYVQTREEVLVNLIENCVGGDSWKGMGGSIGSIRLMLGRLVIVQTPENQFRIAALLRAIHEGVMRNPNRLAKWDLDPSW